MPNRTNKPTKPTEQTPKSADIAALERLNQQAKAARKAKEQRPLAERITVPKVHKKKHQKASRQNSLADRIKGKSIEERITFPTRSLEDRIQKDRNGNPIKQHSARQ
ncbi:hypothetical protein BJ508DRAFT_335560 [Ascobolus immersus RN42]|uniref:Uncharacterized protein n=1 Tax=Ascobolus immersus RN42 TaxID=1160509 RepID=A0A3N4HBV7_ASCIM|nr:hypothetical protein BJ508DRAFT_335560 [Ascobolus immersus RN42]